MKYSNDKRVSFDSETHSYFLKGKRLISVTTLLSRFKNKFDSEHWSKVIAKREKVTQEEILERWKEKAFKSTEIGTAIHKIFEDYTNNKYSVLNGEFVFDYNVLNPEHLTDFNKKKNIALKILRDFFVTKRIMPLHTEYICYNETLAGQIDMIATDSKGNYYILDFKTNEKIDFEAYQNKKMLGALSEIEDCSYYHYCLQLSIYKELLKKEVDIRKMFIIHITTEDYFFIQCEDILEKVKLEDLI
jgi:ATP-dependent exoDNAse (exonuclease V) beta subunit